MEDTLRDSYTGAAEKRQRSLNPCFNGRYSQSIYQTSIFENCSVLILVLMEDTLRVIIKLQKQQEYGS